MTVTDTSLTLLVSNNALCRVPTECVEPAEAGAATGSHARLPRQPPQLGASAHLLLARLSK